MRGEGGFLTNADDDRFMEGYAPNAKDLASRDVVSRAMTIEIQESRGVGREGDHLNLHLSHLGADVIQERLPGIVDTTRLFAGVDVTRQPVPVIPTVHYNMGGIPTNRRGEVVTSRDGDSESVVPGLMAIGEAACVSVHGANRLGSNSLLDLVVFGRAAVIRAAELVGRPRARKPARERDGAEFALQRLDRLRQANGDRPTATIRDELQRRMQIYAAVFRSDETLGEGCRVIAETRASFADARVADRSLIWNTDLIETLELDNLLGCPWSPSTARATEPKAAAPTPGRITPSATTKTGSNTRLRGWSQTVAYASTTDPSTCSRRLTRCRPLPPKERTY